ncbi:MAG: response regulator [Ketobacteraceae bacterium]|nr:response regulator [Ketobacteraceae bacterium]
MLSRILILITAVGFFGQPSFAEAGEFVLPENEFRVDISGRLQVFEDVEGNKSVQDVVALCDKGRCRPTTGKNLQYGYTSSAYWFHFTVISRAEERRRTYLEVRYSPLDYVDVFVIGPDGQVKEMHGGDRIPFSERPAQTNYHLFPVVVQANSVHQVYFRVKSESSVSVPVYYASALALLENEHNSGAFTWGFYGLALGLFCYNIFLGLTTRNTVYFHYDLYIFFSCLFIASLDGLLVRLWPGSPDWESRSIYVFSWLMGFFVLNFSMVFLQTKRDLPRLHLLLSGMRLCLAIGAVAFIFIPIKLAAAINAPSILVLAFSIFIVGLYRALTGFKQAAFFILGIWAFLLGCGSVAAGSMNLHGYYELTPLFLKAGTAMEMFLFSIALGNRINLLEKETQVGRERLLKLELDASEKERKNNQRIIEAQEESHKLKDAFLATMSHELRTPMNGVIGGIELLKSGKLTGQQAHNLELTDRSARTMLSLVEKIMEFIQLQSGISRVARSRFHINDALYGVFNQYADSFRSPELAFKADFKSTARKYATGDKDKLTRILSVLLDNAVKFCDQGVIECVTEQTGENQLSITVKDTGIGIAKEDIDRIFAPFTQLDNKSSRTKGGLGIGLSVAKRLSESLSASLSVKSEPGKGTEFTLLVGMDIEESPSGSSEAGYQRKNGELKASELSALLEGLRVLIVEDNPVNQAILEKLMRSAGCIVNKANNGREALDFLADHTADFVLMDCQMPVMDGYEASRQIRNSHQSYSNIPIIAVTANVTDQDRERVFDAGMNDIVAKPFKLTELLKTILHQLPERQATRCVL